MERLTCVEKGNRCYGEVVLARETYLVLDEELNTLNGSSSGLRDGGGDTTHCKSWLAHERGPSYCEAPKCSSHRFPQHHNC